MKHILSKDIPGTTWTPTGAVNFQLASLPIDVNTNFPGGGNKYGIITVSWYLVLIAAKLNHQWEKKQYQTIQQDSRKLLLTSALSTFYFDCRTTAASSPLESLGRHYFTWLSWFFRAGTGVPLVGYTAFLLTAILPHIAEISRKNECM